MFEELSFKNSSKYDISAISANYLIYEIENRFDMKKLKKGDTAIYIFLLDEDRKKYSEEAKEELSKFLDRAFCNQEISSKRISNIAFCVEYSVKKNQVTEYFAIDKSILNEVKELGEILLKKRIIELTV